MSYYRKKPQSIETQNSIVSFLQENAGKHFTSAEIAIELCKEKKSIIAMIRSLNMEGAICKYEYGAVIKYFIKTEKQKLELATSRTPKPFKPMPVSIPDGLARAREERGEATIITCAGVGNKNQFGNSCEPK